MISCCVFLDATALLKLTTNRMTSFLIFVRIFGDNSVVSRPELSESSSSPHVASSLLDVRDFEWTDMSDSLRSFPVKLNVHVLYLCISEDCLSTFTK